MTEELTYEKALELLDRRLRDLEEGELTLEQALAAAEEAATYLRACQERLAEAKRKIEVRAEASPPAEPDEAPPAEEGRLL